MKVRIEIEMDNAAFDADRAGRQYAMPEVGRILAGLGREFAEFGALASPPRDCNGNKVGKITFSGMGRKRKQ